MRGCNEYTSGCPGLVSSLHHTVLYLPCTQAHQCDCLVLVVGYGTFMGPCSTSDRVYSYCAVCEVVGMKRYVVLSDIAKGAA